MAKSLPLLLVQAPSRPPASATEELHEEVTGLLAEFPATQMVVCPEFHLCAVNGGPDERRREYEELAEPLSGPRTQQLREIARQAGVWLLPGTMPERGDDGALYNTALALSPEGEIAASYRKIFPWRPTEPFKPGRGFVVFDVPGTGRIGLVIGYDLWYPEVARQLAWMGADVLLHPTQTPHDRTQELVLARAAAITNQVFVVSVNSAAPVGTGRSVVVDPEGIVHGQAPSEMSLALADVIDLDQVARVRTFGTCGLDRMWSQFRPDDASLELPVYQGAIDPLLWEPGTHPGGDVIDPPRESEDPTI
jgi:predicted amidohydrolase